MIPPASISSGEVCHQCAEPNPNPSDRLWTCDSCIGDARAELNSDSFTRFECATGDDSGLVREVLGGSA